MNNVLRFIEDLETKCKEYGVKLVLYDMKFIENDGDKFGGWFDADNKRHREPGSLLPHRS